MTSANSKKKKKQPQLKKKNLNLKKKILDLGTQINQPQQWVVDSEQGSVVVPEAMTNLSDMVMGRMQQSMS